MKKDSLFRILLRSGWSLGSTKHFGSSSSFLVSLVVGRVEFVEPVVRGFLDFRSSLDFRKICASRDRAVGRRSSWSRGKGSILFAMSGKWGKNEVLVRCSDIDLRCRVECPLSKICEWNRSDSLKVSSLCSHQRCQYMRNRVQKERNQHQKEGKVKPPLRSISLRSCLLVSDSRMNLNWKNFWVLNTLGWRYGGREIQPRNSSQGLSSRTACYAFVERCSKTLRGGPSWFDW